MSFRRFLLAAALLLVTVGASGAYVVHAFPLLSGDEVLTAPPAPALSSPATMAVPAPAPVPPAAPVAQERYTGTPVWLELKDADLPATLRALAQHGGRVAEVDPAVSGKVSASLNNVPWDQALAFMMRANRLTSVTEGNTIRISPSADAPAAAAAPVQAQQPPATSVRIESTPKVIRDVKPEYPAEAMRAGIEGSVEIEVTIGYDGKVTSSRVVQSSNPVFDQAALSAASQWLFSKPTEAPVVRTIELTFALRSTRRNTASTTGFGAGDVSPDAVRVGGNIRAPRKIRHVAPAYPEVARQANVRGMVILEILVDREGRVTDAKVLRSIPLLDAAAVDAVMQWTFTPTLLNGTPVPVIMTVTVNFTEL